MTEHETVPEDKTLREMITESLQKAHPTESASLSAMELCTNEFVTKMQAALADSSDEALNTEVESILAWL